MPACSLLKLFWLCWKLFVTLQRNSRDTNSKKDAFFCSYSSVVNLDNSLNDRLGIKEEMESCLVCTRIHRAILPVGPFTQTLFCLSGVQALLLEIWSDMDGSTFLFHESARRAYGKQKKQYYELFIRKHRKQKRHDQRS